MRCLCRDGPPRVVYRGRHGSHRRRRSIRPQVATVALGVVASVVAVAAVTGAIELLQLAVPVLSLGVLYIFAVLPIAVLWGTRFGIGVAIASMLAFNWFFLPPIHTFTLADSRNWLALAVFVVTAVVVSELAARSRRRATESELLAGIATSLLARGDVRGELERIASEVHTSSRSTGRGSSSARARPGTAPLTRSWPAPGGSASSTSTIRGRAGWPPGGG